jgi:hypothetical protein
MSTESELPAVTDGPSIAITEIQSRPWVTSNDAGIGGIIRLLQTHGELLWGDYNGAGSEDSQMVLAGWIAPADEVV